MVSLEEYTPKRVCSSGPSRTTVDFDKDYLKKLGPAADRLNLSNPQLTGIVAAIANHGGGDINNIALSKSTARRHRASARKVLATNVKENFTCGVGKINFDGKLLPNLHGFGRVNRLAVVLVQHPDNKILCISKLESSTGKVEAETVKEALDDWDVTDKIIACGFDTTSSNTGVRNGSCVLLQQLLSRQLLWLACRHHILELVIGAAFFQLSGDTKAPDVILFKMLKKSWDSLNLDDLRLPDIPKTYRGETHLHKLSTGAWERERYTTRNILSLRTWKIYYQEYLELTKLILGGSIDRKNGYVYQIQRPGADHHARWMSKAIYILKMSLLIHQLDLHWNSLFINLIYTGRQRRKYNRWHSLQYLSTGLLLAPSSLRWCLMTSSCTTASRSSRW